MADDEHPQSIISKDTGENLDETTSGPKEPVRALLSLGHQEDATEEGCETASVETVIAVPALPALSPAAVVPGVELSIGENNDGFYTAGNDAIASVIIQQDQATGICTTTKKRKLILLNNTTAGQTQPNPDNKYPPDFSHYLDRGDSVGDLDVLCGRGGESNNHIGNRRYRKVVDDKKAEYRKIDARQRKLKTNFVKNIVTEILDCGGRFLDVDSQGRYYVVTIEKARKKTSQALRETKELKWLNINERKRKKGNTISNKDIICPFCKKSGHKTKTAKACLFHHEWLHANKSSSTSSSLINHATENGGAGGAGGAGGEGMICPTSTTGTFPPIEPTSDAAEPKDSDNPSVLLENTKSTTEVRRPISEEVLKTTEHHVQV